MKIKHSAVKSPFYEIAKVVELDLQFGDDFFPVRFELLRNTENKRHFRCRIWAAERFKIQSTFPMNRRGKPLHHPSDELILIEFLGAKMGDYSDFKAASADAALEKILEDFRQFLEHSTLEEPK